MDRSSPDIDESYLREMAVKCAEIGDAMFQLIPAASKDIREYSLLQVRVLQSLHIRPMKMKDLATLLCAPPSTTTYIADSLEKRGLIERKRESADRRVVTVHLTAEGRRVMERLADFKIKLWMSILREIHESEGTAFLEGFSGVHRAIMNYRKKHAPESNVDAGR
ncbi:MAG: MarR family winged helix-turn-helix transcriptional regulator [Vulcanimicrobiota bacterium]